MNDISNTAISRGPVYVHTFHNNNYINASCIQYSSIGLGRSLKSFSDGDRVYVASIFVGVNMINSIKSCILNGDLII